MSEELIPGVMKNIDAKTVVIASHRAGGDAFVTILEGRANITIDDDVYTLEAGQSIVMPLGHPHALQAPEEFKMLLVVVYPQK